MKKFVCVILSMFVYTVILSGAHPHHGHRPGPHHYVPGPRYYHHGPYYNSGLNLAAGICNIVGGAIRTINPPVYVVPAQSYVSQPVTYYPPVYTPTVYYVNGKPVAEQRVEVIHNYHIEQTVTGSGTATVVIQRQ